MKFAKSHLRNTVNYWSSVIFSDESTFRQMDSKGRSWVWESKENKNSKKRIKLKVQQDGFAVGVWAAITPDGILHYKIYTGTLDKEGYIKILEELIDVLDDKYPQKVGAAGRKRAAFKYMHDGATCHHAKIVKKFIGGLGKKFPTILDWPAYSPDLNPIEHVWSSLKQMHRKMNIEKGYPTNVEELTNRLNFFMKKIHENKEFFHNLYESMPNRCKTVVRAKGSSNYFY